MLMSQIPLLPEGKDPQCYKLAPSHGPPHSPLPPPFPVPDFSISLSFRPFRTLPLVILILPYFLSVILILPFGKEKNLETLRFPLPLPFVKGQGFGSG